MKNFYLFLILLAGWGSMTAQQRYLDPIFEDVTVTTDIIYGVNATVILLSQLGEAVPQPLTMDVYEPADDTEEARPLVIMLHTGNFLPPSVNGGCTGTNKDADLVYIANELAKRGYVVAPINYRLGWNPISPDPTIRVASLINAVYRGVQDSRTAIRYFRRSVAEQDNPFGVDTDKITLWGIGTGGYIALASNTVDTITDSYIPKFLTPLGPMVIEPVNGNVQGTTVGVTFPGYPGFPPNDTLCYPNHVGYTDEFALTVNMGGALGDSSWVTADDGPMISFQVPTDPFAPCGIGTVLVPPPINLPVVEVVGACYFQNQVAAAGLNSAFANFAFADEVTNIAKARNGGIEGFLPFPSSDPAEGAPWNYSASAEPYGVPGSDCDTDSETAHVYIDSIMQYFLPRACLTLDLGCDLWPFTSTKEVVTPASVQLQILPNPATDMVQFSTAADRPMLDILLYDLNGRLVETHLQIQQNQYSLNRGSLPPGMYVAQIRFAEGIAVGKVVFR